MTLASRALLVMCLAAAPPYAGAQGSSVAIERVEPGRWRATYQLDAPARALRFARPAAWYRERAWTVRTAGYRWTRSGSSQVLVAEPRAATRTIVVEFPEFSETLPKEYEFFQPFTDGGVAVYTGHLYATPDSASEIRTVRLVPPTGTNVVVRGQVSSGPTIFRDSIGDGTYAYLGNARPIETASVVAIVDAGMPSWLREAFDEHLPRFFEAYRERLGAALPWKPVVLFSFHDTASSGYSSGGGTLTGLVTMTLTGNAWRTRNDAAFAQAVHLMAHEAAHLWNGQLVASPGDSASWMHEGSADAMANDLLLAAGIIDTARHRANREAALNQCAMAIAAGSVHRAAARGAFRTFYDCGATLALWTEAVVRRATPGADLFTFWRDLIARARPRGTYDESLYFDVLRSARAPDAVVSGMRAFLRDSTVQVVVAGLTTAGVPVRANAVAPPVRQQREYARQALMHLMQAACGRVDFNWGPPAVTGAVQGCAPFGTSHRVAAMEGHDLAAMGAAAFDAVRVRCEQGAPVTLADGTGAVVAAVPCRSSLRARPPWYTLYP